MQVALRGGRCIQPLARHRQSAAAVAIIHGAHGPTLSTGHLARCLQTLTAEAASSSGTLKFQITGAVAEELSRGKGPLAMLEALISSGELRDDSEQRRIVEYLNAVFHGLAKGSARGLYLYGSVGCGKTMVMDLFFEAVRKLPGLRVERKHFHDFLHDVQVQLHRLRLDNKGPLTDQRPVELVGEAISKRTDVLCFDEFAVTTIQDCVILMPLFSSLFRHGVTLVCTSNRAPEDLYSDGLNRHLYLPPFLQMLRAQCKVHQLISSTDYRRVHYENSADANVFCWPPDHRFMDRWFEFVTGGAGGEPKKVSVTFGRSVKVPQLSACGRVARFSFADICGTNLSADDYVSLSRRFHTILLDDIPCLTVDNHNEARRFTTLIDSCYEQHVRLICSMEGSPEALLGGLTELQEMSTSSLGGGMAGCGDGDTAPSSSGVLEAIGRIKTSLAQRRGEGAPASPVTTTFEEQTATEVLSAEVARVRAHGENDIDVWRQGGEYPSDSNSLTAPPQVSKSWDDRRRISQFTWESTDPTSEQQSIKGVFTAAVASLKETGFAVERAISRLREMQTDTFQENHRIKHQLAN